MPTKDIKVDYLATGDGQIGNFTVSFINGSPNLQVFSNTFSGADVNKIIAIQDWLPIPPDGSNPAGVFVSNINSVGSFAAGSQTLVLDSNAQRTFSNAVKQIEWGHNDHTAFANFRADFPGQTGVVLNIPAGRYLGGNRQATIPIGQGIKGLTINGTGNPVLSDMLGGGDGFNPGGCGRVLMNDNTMESLIQTIPKGTTILPFVTGSDASKYTANTWAWLTGFDTQGFGNPPNPAFAEYVFITAVDLVGGTVTIQTPTKYAYKSNWPRWDTGSPTQFSLGGPATLYVIDQNWDCTHVYNGIGFKATGTLYNMNGRDMTMNNCFSELWPVNISQQKRCVINNHGTVVTGWEIDKDTEVAIISDTIAPSLTVQSMSPFSLTLNNVTASLNGTPDVFVANNCTFATDSVFGPSSYGVCRSVECHNCTFAGQTGVGGVKETDLSGAGAYSMSGGVISRNRVLGTGAPTQWAVPDHYFYFGSRYNEEEPVVYVKDVVQSGSTILISTDQTGGFPSPVSPATFISAISAPPVKFTFTGCTGCDDATGWSAVPGGRQQLSQWKNIYPGNIGIANPAHLIKVAGQVKSIIITVAAGYSAGTFNLDGPIVVAKPGNTSATWTPIIDLTVPGTRTIKSDGTVTGTAGADSGLALPNSGNVWLVDNQLTAAMSGVVGTGSITLEIKADLGISTDPTAASRIRFH